MWRALSLHILNAHQGKKRFLNFVPQSTQNSVWWTSNLKSILAGLKWILISFIFLLPPPHPAQIGEKKKIWNQNTALAITIWVTSSASRDLTNLILFTCLNHRGLRFAICKWIHLSSPWCSAFKHTQDQRVKGKRKAFVSRCSLFL